MKQAHSNAMRIVLGLAPLLMIGCVEAGLCSSNCPKMEGNYAMTYRALTVQSADCAAVPAAEGPRLIQITRSGAEVRATLNGASGRGMLQDTSDFSIAATEEPDGGTDAGSDGGAGDGGRGDGGTDGGTDGGLADGGQGQGQGGTDGGGDGGQGDGGQGRPDGKGAGEDGENDERARSHIP